MLKYSQDQFPLCVHVHGCSWTLFAVCVSAHSSKTHSDESRPELVLRLTLGSLAVSVLHIDPLPPPHAAPSPLGPMAAHFFSMVGPGQLEPAAFLQSRVVFNQACPHDHLRCTSNFNKFLYSEGMSMWMNQITWITWAYVCRFVGQGLKLNYDHWQGSNLRTFSTDFTLNQMEFLECLFTSEAVIGGSQKGVQYTEVRPSSLSFVHLSLHNALDVWTLRICIYTEHLKGAAVLTLVFHFSFSLTPQLLTFDTKASADAPLTTCLHLLYKQAERRGPQVTASVSSIWNHNTLTIKCRSSTMSVWPLLLTLCLAVQGGQVRLSTIPRKAEIQVELGPVHSELDISIVDRLNSLLQPQKLATTEAMASHMYTSYNKPVSLVSVVHHVSLCFLCICSDIEVLV